MRRRMSGRGWWMVMMTVTPAEARPDRMSTTLAALLLSSPAHQEQHEVCTLTPDRMSSILEALLLSKPAAECMSMCDTTPAQPRVFFHQIRVFLQG